MVKNPGDCAVRATPTPHRISDAINLPPHADVIAGLCPGNPLSQELGPEGFTAEIGFTRFRTPQVRKSDKSDLRGQARGGESCRAGRRVRPLSVRLLVLP